MYKSWKRIRKRERGGFLSKESYWKTHFSMKRTKRKMYKTWKTIRKRESEFLKFEEREKERKFLGRELYWENHFSLSLFLFFSWWMKRTRRRMYKSCKRIREREREREWNSKRERGGDFWTENRIGRARWRETFDLSGRVHDRIVGTRILLQQPLRC